MKQGGSNLLGAQKRGVQAERGVSAAQASGALGASQGQVRTTGSGRGHTSARQPSIHSVRRSSSCMQHSSSFRHQ